MYRLCDRVRVWSELSFQNRRCSSTPKVSPLPPPAPTLYFGRSTLSITLIHLCSILFVLVGFICSVAEKSNPNPPTSKNRAFMRELGKMIMTNKWRIIHAVLLMTVSDPTSLYIEAMNCLPTFFSPEVHNLFCSCVDFLQGFNAFSHGSQVSSHSCAS